MLPVCNQIICLIFFLAFLAACSSSNIEDSLRRAQGLVGIGKYEQATKIYQQILEKNTQPEQKQQVLLLLADLYVNSLGDVVKGLDIYQQCIEINPYSEAALNAHQKRAEIFERKGLSQQLVEEYAVIYKYFPKAQYRLHLGEAFIANKDYEQARVELREFLEDPEVSQEWKNRVLFDIGESYFLENKPHEALKFYFAFLEMAPKSKLASEVKLRIASCFEEMGRLGMAQKYTQKALEDYPNKQVVQERLEALKKRGKTGSNKAK